MTVAQIVFYVVLGVVLFFIGIKIYDLVKSRIDQTKNPKSQPTVLPAQKNVSSPGLPSQGSAQENFLFTLGKKNPETPKKVVPVVRNDKI